MIQKIIALLVVANLYLMVGCSANTPSSALSEQTSSVQSQETTTTDAEDVVENQSTIYIGLDGMFSEYLVTSEYADFDDAEKASLFLEDLMSEMGSLTGWNLACDISVYKTIGVAFPSDSTIFVGPPEIQKEEFHMFDAYQLVQTILDSVTKTIQMNISAENPDLIEVYFSTDTDEALTFPDLDTYVPLGECYAGLVLMPENVE